MNRKKDIIEIMMKMSGSRSPYEVFCDWVKCSAIAIQNASCVFHGDTWKKREQQYMETIKPYGAKGESFGEMLALLAETLEEDMTDVLGKIYMEAELGNKSTGQFFTPFHVSYMTAKLSLMNQFDHFSENDQIELNEPSCGAGGMIIAAAKILKERGINYQKNLHVVAQDLDWKAVYMCYIQMSFLGIKGRVVQGDTLSDPYIEGYPPERVFRTPADMGVLI